MTDFKDFDPEDAYDAGDAPEMRLDVLRRIVADLQKNRSDPRLEIRRSNALRLVRKERDGDTMRQNVLDELNRDLEAI